MHTLQGEHPSPEQLTAFGLGRLDEATSALIETHLGSCDRCRSVVEALPNDTLLSLLQKPPAPAASTLVLSTGATELGTTLPPELAGHARYHVLELLGRGGMGSVYKAEHRLMERLVALKVINPALLQRPAVVERFRREVKAAARLSHPHIVTAYDADAAGEAHFLVMEFVEGISLAQHVERHGPLPVAQACDYIRQAALGLQFAAEHGMVHRDIKPHNLMLTPGGQVKILDFGLARLVREEASGADDEGAQAELHHSPLTDAGTLMGTADFIAPEQARDPREADVRADLYSLGCTLYYLLAGHAPFPGGTALDKLTAHRERKPAPLTKRRSDVPSTLTAVLDRLMAKDPAQRYQTPAEVAEALRAFTAAAVARRRRVKRLALAGAAVLALVLLLGAVIYVQTDKGEIVLETDSDQVAVLVQGMGVKVRDLATNREYELKIGGQRFRPGEYQLDVRELPAGVEFSPREAFTLKRGDRTVLTVRYDRRKDPRYLRAQALNWFPAEATCYCTWRTDPFPELTNFGLLQWKEMVAQYPDQNAARFRKFVDLLGTINRLAIAYIVDRQHPERSRCFNRFTGDIKRTRLIDFFREEGVTVEETVVDGEPIALIHEGQAGVILHGALALIGTSELVLAGFMGRSENALAVVRECLDLRAGRGATLATAQGRALAEFPANAWLLGMGEPPEFLKKSPLMPGILATARSFEFSVGGDNDVEMHFRGSFANKADTRLFLAMLNLMKLAFGNARVVTDNPALSDAVARAFHSLRVEEDPERIHAEVQIPSLAWAALLQKLQDMPLRDYSKAFKPDKQP